MTRGLVGSVALLFVLGGLNASAVDIPSQEGVNVRPVDVVRIPESPDRHVPGDEIDQLETRLQPEPRFKDYRPDWRVETRTFRFAHHGKTVTKDYEVVRDGDKVVALKRSGDILLIARTPETAGTRLALPTERLHLDNLPGPSLPTWQFLKKVKTHGTILLSQESEALPAERWEVGPRHLAHVRNGSTPRYDVKARFVFTVDPVYGYRIDAVRELSFAEPVDRNQIRLGAGTFCPGCYVPWDHASVYDRTVYTPESGGFRGWANNLVSMDRSNTTRDFTWRDDGFITYLPHREGWSPVFTRKDAAGTTHSLNICNAHNDFHIKLFVPALQQADARGRYPYSFTHRLMSLPPEMTRHVWDNVDLIQQGASKVIVKIGKVEDFEDQPVPLSEPARGLVWTGRDPELVKGGAHSGETSLRIRGRSWPNLPQIGLLPGRRYRLEGWFKVIPWTGEEIETQKKKHDSRRKKLVEKGKPPPPEKDWSNLRPRAWIEGDFYEWSPHSGKMLVEQQTPETTRTDGTWEHVKLDFTAPEWGPFINIVFHVRDGEALLDDFALRMLEEEGGNAPKTAGRHHVRKTK